MILMEGKETECGLKVESRFSVAPGPEPHEITLSNSVYEFIRTCETHGIKVVGRVSDGSLGLTNSTTLYFANESDLTAARLLL
ncbi:hypothetical protein ATE69_13420 [Sphingopyxis sp. H071]|nr:hypothetical protein ATE61_20230 [Sphingopyxis sp. H057]KTE48881.1 hypothetical protein ATE64_20180 [Sphingopyxis sp. H073]KTE53308.1 hypothetical protein ATE69_13420 [Sphingopyxis sp. H071]KTE55332.1 hypothetical protein ATE66_19775 [Sphingopyxis sp. H107]KTE60211.1 hypothetical protein ATE65_19540 [Sphingopyxis sp. H100]KTE70997.1 hypothetical protein ATE60_14370 [Sphingopyxis sp. H081]KTE75893.1 hypothetical protein ATE63_20250 [Sphingopyxis sp. H067]